MFFWQTDSNKCSQLNSKANIYVCRDPKRAQHFHRHSFIKHLSSCNMQNPRRNPKQELSQNNSPKIKYHLHHNPNRTQSIKAQHSPPSASLDHLSPQKGTSSHACDGKGVNERIIEPSLGLIPAEFGRHHIGSLVVP